MDSKDYEDTDPWLPQQTVTDSNGNDCVYTNDSKHCNGFHKNTIKAIPRNSNGCNGHVVSNGDAPHATDIEGVTRPRPSNHCFSSRKHLSITKDLPKHIRRYYKDQNALIETYEEMRENLESNSNSESKSERRTTKMASLMSKITFAMNLLLLVAKAVAAGLSASLVMISSMLDSCMDLVSGALMWWSNRAIKNTNFTLYPRGRRKLEPVAIVVLAVIMSFVSVQVIHESVQKIIIYATQNFDEELMEIHAWMSSFNTTSPHAATLDVNSSDTYQPPLVPEMFTRIHRMHELLENCAKGHRAPVFEMPTILICVATIVAKLVLFLICRRIDNPSVQALAKDHFNDVISNSGAIACGIIGYRLWVYADPLGAIIISLSIIINWSITAYEQIKMLTGYTAHPDFIKKVTWLALYHDERIQYIESVIAFHFGIRYLVEVTIVLPGEMSMRESHDLCESLQSKIERLPEVERTFIHIDYECGWIINSAKYSMRDEATETADDATRTNDDATRKYDDATRKYDDATRTNDDAIVEEVV